MRTDQHYKQGALVASSTFPRRDEAVPAARKWAVDKYLRAGGTEAETCALLVSELVTNAVEYAEGDRFEVAVRASPFSIDVSDGSPKEPERQGPSDEDEHGRGLILVHALSAHFEVKQIEGGKTCSFWLEG